jgi:hypothetical protein
MKLQYRIQLNEYIDSLLVVGKDTLVFGGEESQLYSLSLSEG